VGISFHGSPQVSARATSQGQGSWRSPPRTVHCYE
jgi:hypothetical protein